jgi:hypothetical protein
MFIQTQRIDYPDHKDEIAVLNDILACIPKPFPPEFKPVVEMTLARLDQLMVASQAQVRLYDPREERC